MSNGSTEPVEYPIRMIKRTDEILVIDDEANYAEMVVSLLANAGYRADMRTSPTDALDALRQRSYSLIILDYKMPQLDGAEFLKQMRELHPHLPVIMISGYMNTPELLKVANIGVTLVLEKPFDSNGFLEHVRRFSDPPETGGQEAAHKAAKTTSTPYPAGSCACSEVSTEARTFLQALWDGLNRGGVTLVAPLGAELDLVIRDVETWFKLEPPSLRVSPPMLKHQDMFELVANALTLVDARDGSTTPAPLVEILRTRLGPRAPLVVVVRNDSGGPVANMPLVYLPPLAIRPQDVAEYARRVIAATGRDVRLSAECARVLLNYPWPGNYHELVGAIRRAVAVTTGKELSADTLEDAIIEGHGSVPPGVEAATLELYLKRRQVDLLNGAGSTDPSEALRAAGVEPERTDPGKPLNQQPLLYPEILRTW